MSTPQVQDSSVSVPARQVGKSGGFKKKTNKMQEKARSAFDSSAPSMSVEKFFSDYTEAKRNNVDVTLDLTLPERIAEPYVKRMFDHAHYKLQLPQNDISLTTTTKALISFGLIRKLLMTIPGSQEHELAPLRDFLRQDLLLPRAAATAIDNIGKFELDDLVCRIKYHSLDTMRLAVKMCATMEMHPRFRNRFAAPRPRWVDPVPGQRFLWGEIDSDQIVDGSKDSARWIREEGAKYLRDAFDRHWEIPVPDTDRVMNVSYPRLKMSPNLHNQLRNVTDWIDLLSADMPDIELVLAAGICTAWHHEWFSPDPFRILVPDFPDWLPFDSPHDVLLAARIQPVSWSGSEIVFFLRAIYDHLADSVPMLSEVFNLIRQPDNKFGSPAMLSPLTSECFKEHHSYEFGSSVWDIVRGCSSRMLTKVKNKGQVVSGLIFGFTTNVETSANFLATVNGDPNSLRQQYLRSDFKNV